MNGRAEHSYILKHLVCIKDLSSSDKAQSQVTAQLFS